MKGVSGTQQILFCQGDRREALEATHYKDVGNKSNIVKSGTINSFTQLFHSFAPKVINFKIPLQSHQK